MKKRFQRPLAVTLVALLFVFDFGVASSAVHNRACNHGLVAVADCNIAVRLDMVQR